MHRALLAVFGLSFALAGCQNDCQKVCYEMADLFDACGQDYDQSEVLDCLDENSDPDEATLAVCEDTRGNLQELLEYKSPTGDACDELTRYSDGE